MDKSDCAGCYNNIYNGQLAKECWMFEDAKLIMRKEVSIHQRPPWNQAPRKLPNCYSKQGYIYVGPDRIN